MDDDRRKRTVSEESNSSGGGSWVKGCLLALVIVGVFAVLTTSLLVGLVIAGGFMGVDSKKKASVPLKEVVVQGEDKAPKLAVIPVEGVIFGSPSPVGSVTPLAVACARVKRAMDDPDVQGVLLEINSPGGGITASDILHRRIQRLTRGSNAKPVVVHVRDVAASGGYYVASAADSIWAHPTSITGSIGVIMPIYKATELMEKVGVENKSIMSGPYKDMGSPFAENTESQSAAERRILQGIIDEMYGRFVQVVAEGRDLEESKVKEVADGRIYTSEQAKKRDLIDHVGYRDGAMKELKKLCGIKRSVQLIYYRRVLSFTDLLNSALGSKNVSIEVPGNFDMQNLSRPMYLWAPGKSENSTDLLQR